MTALPHHRAMHLRPDHRLAFGLLALLLLLVLVASWHVGATSASPLSWVMGQEISGRDRMILLQIRLPRLVLAALVGGGLAVSGAVMQGLFRNPLADPGLVGVGAGAGLGAVLAIVLGGVLPVVVTAVVGLSLVPLSAFLGGWLVTWLLYKLASRGGETAVATLLLAGIGVGALAGAATGVVIFLANDTQLRDLTFWGLGSLSGASWPRLAVAGPVLLLALILAPCLAPGLNALALGEAAAMHMGIAVEPLKTRAILLVAAATGAAVAVSGGIGFVGIVVPHLVRLSVGPDHRLLLPASALLGAVALVLADMVARSIVAPAELPIGIVTALIGAPAFLWLLLARRGLVEG
jgi:iron complex transport system permease protein